MAFTKQSDFAKTKTHNFRQPEKMTCFGKHDETRGFGVFSICLQTPRFRELFTCTRWSVMSRGMKVLADLRTKSTALFKVLFTCTRCSVMSGGMDGVWWVNDM